MLTVYNFLNTFWNDEKIWKKIHELSLLFLEMKLKIKNTSLSETKKFHCKASDVNWHRRLRLTKRGGKWGNWAFWFTLGVSTCVPSWMGVSYLWDIVSSRGWFHKCAKVGSVSISRHTNISVQLRELCKGLAVSFAKWLCTWPWIHLYQCDYLLLTAVKCRDGRLHVS